MSASYRHESYGSVTEASHSPGRMPEGRSLLGAYDAAILALDAGEGEVACDLLAWLFEMVQSEQRRVSGALFRLCRYCSDEIRRGELDAPMIVLRELRGTWTQVLLPV